VLGDQLAALVEGQCGVVVEDLGGQDHLVAGHGDRLAQLEADPAPDGVGSIAEEVSGLAHDRGALGCGQRRPRALVAIDDAPPLEAVDPPAEQVETIDALWSAVEELNPDLKMALLLRDIVGLSYNEIADSLDTTLATVKWRIFKAREEVQLALAREGITFAPSTRPAAAPAELAS
jgi:RNA polymerase sigma factor (sigma-70 family)